MTKVIKVLEVLKGLKSKVFPETQGKFLAVSPYKKIRKKLNTFNILWHRVNIPISKGGMEDRKGPDKNKTEPQQGKH